MNEVDNSIEIFYDELINKIRRDDFENSYAEFKYTFNTKTELYNCIQNDRSTQTPFYNNFIMKYSTYDINIKELKILDCSQMSERLPKVNGKYPRSCRYIEKYNVNFIVFFVKSLQNIDMILHPIL